MFYSECPLPGPPITAYLSMTYIRFKKIKKSRSQNRHFSGNLHPFGSKIGHTFLENGWLVKDVKIVAYKSI